MPAATLVGQRVESVEAQGKHLLIRLDSGQVLHSHMRMTGSWHVYKEGDRWRRPESQARLVLACGQRIAVCFNAPVIELMRPKAVHPSIAKLGPDLLVDPFDVKEVIRRARSTPPQLALGELLLDQRVVAGIGNIWRCEALFVAGCNPWTPQTFVTDEALEHLVLTASRLMRRQLGLRDPNAMVAPWQPEMGERWVYKRTGRPCRRCGTAIESRRQGELARTTYWCPGCQA